MRKLLAILLLLPLAAHATNPATPAFTGYNSLPSRSVVNLGMNPAGQLQILSVDPLGNLNVNCVVGCGGGGGSGANGAAGSTGSTAQYIQGIPGGTPAPVSVTVLPLPTGAATSSAQPALNVDGGGLAHVTNFPTSQTVTDTATAALSTAQAGPGLRVLPQAAAQQTPAGDTSVSVPASTSTVAWTTSASARVLRVVPSIATCTMRSDGGAASATSTPIPGGYVWTLIEPPPNANITIWCPSAATVAVSPGN